MNGLLYIALGASYLDEARRSAASAKVANPGLATAVVTDQAIEADADFDHVLAHEAPALSGDERFLARDRTAYFLKILPLLRSPFERTIFLDTDTWVSGDLGPAFELMSRFDLLVTPAHIVRDYAFERDEAPFSEVPDAFGYFNSGFFGFRRGEATRGFIEVWQSLYEGETRRFTVNDQPALRLALWRERQASFHVLPTAYNIVSWAPFVVPGGGRVVVLHGRNPWLQRWAAHFRADRPAIVGTLNLPLLARYHLARALNAARRLLRQGK